MNPYAKILGKRDPLRVAASTPAKIEALIRGVSARELGKRPQPGKWSIAEIIRHLAETEMVMCCRARWIAFEDNSTLVPFDQDKWASGWAREKESAPESLERLRVLRRSQIKMFKSVPRKDFKRTGYHPERGVVSLREQLETLAGHDLNHLGQIERLAAPFKRKGGASGFAGHRSR